MPRQPQRTAEQRPAKTPEQAFGDVLRGVRKEKAVTQEALAHRGGYHRTYIGQLERGEKSPSLRTLFNLAEALDVSPTDLIRRVVEMRAAR